MTTLPGGVDSAIRRIENAFDNHGRLEKVMSYDANDFIREERRIFMAALPDDVKAKHWYQTNGCYGRRCPGPYAWYKSAEIKGAINKDYTSEPSLSVPNKNYDHMDMPALAGEAANYAF